MHLNHVAGRPGEGRNDRGFALGDPVEQCGFSGIRRPRNGDNQAIAQAFAAAGLGEGAGNLVMQLTGDIEGRAD